MAPNVHQCLQWRRNPVPARFLGVQDHIIIRDIPEHKVRSNEVFCTEI
jgi:hypothetical protein